MFNKGLKKKSVYHVIILDESSSMTIKRDAVVSGFKEYVEQISKSASEGLSTHYLSLITFNNAYSVKLTRVPLDIAKAYNIDTYKPAGMTALFDAIGAAISSHKDLDNNDNTFIFNIFTDGQENMSREYTQSQIQEMISGLRATNRWVFNYMGVEEDAIGTARAMGIAQSNVMRYENTSHGTLKSMAYVARAAANYSTALEKGVNLSTTDFMDMGKEDKA